MPDLVSHHEPRLIETKNGWTVCHHRSAMVRWQGMQNVLRLAGCPLDGKNCGQAHHWFEVVDH
jgi:hypothetical protein